MSEGTTASVMTFFISAACAAFLITMCVEIKGCSDRSDRESTEREQSAQQTIRACISSQRTAMDCALIVRGTGR